jgi:hypothetical protein
MKMLLLLQFVCRRTRIDRISKANRALGPNTKIETSDCQFHLPVEICKGWNQGGWVWSKVDGAKIDLVLINH